MTFAALGREACRDHVMAHYGVPSLTSIEAIAEVIRAELFALGHTLRWVLAHRVTKLLAPFEVTGEAIASSLQALEIAGDLLAGPGSEVARAPLLAVAVRDGRWLFSGTLPTRELGKGLDGIPSGLPRRLATHDDEQVRRAVTALRGREVNVARWAGLDRTPPVERWIEELNARISMSDRFAERALALSWDAQEVYGASGRWRATEVGEEPVLLRAPQAGGWNAYAWARRADRTTVRVPLTRDEARRTTLAVDASAGEAVALAVARTGHQATIALPVVLPSAEYRWLSAMGEMTAEPRGVTVEGALLAEVGTVLRERLSAVLVVDGAPWP
jgi:hypothetical protein